MEWEDCASWEVETNPFPWRRLGFPGLLERTRILRPVPLISQIFRTDGNRHVLRDRGWQVVALFMQLESDSLALLCGRNAAQQG